MDTQEDYTTQLRAVRVLAKGSFGVATLMRHEGSGELVVRKSVSLIGLSERARKQAFREVQVLRQCCREVHPFVCRFVTATMKGDELHIYLEYCEGGDLATFIKQRGVEYLSEEAVIDIFAQICLAVKHIHDQRVLHRDIKAQNVFLRADGSVCLGDFGISRLLADTGAMAMTILGTPLSLAPELCEGRAYDNKTDCWALGCLLHQLCALHHPFAAPNMKSLVAKILAGDRRRLPDRYTPKVQELVDALLDRQPSRRPSINEILRIPFIRLKAEAYLTKYGQIKTERKSCVEEPDHADDAKQNLEQIDNLFCFRFKNSTLKLAQRSQSKECRVSMASACEQVRVFLENNVAQDTLLAAYQQLRLLDATDLGSPEFDQVVSRFQLILLDDEARGVRNGGEPATAFAELIQRLYVCETVAFEYCKVVEGK